MKQVAQLEQLWSGEMMGLVVDGQRVLLVNVDGTVHAYEDRCLHKGVALSDGKLRGTVLTCSAHDWQYDVCTGTGINPRGIALRAFPVELRGEGIWIDVGAGRQS